MRPWPNNSTPCRGGDACDQNTHWPIVCREAKAVRPSRGGGNGRPSATVGRCLARIRDPSVAAVGRFCRPEMSAYVTLQVSVVDPQLCKTTSRSISSGAGNFFDSFSKVLIVGVPGWRRLLTPSNCETITSENTMRKVQLTFERVSTEARRQDRSLPEPTLRSQIEAFTDREEGRRHGRSFHHSA